MAERRRPSNEVRIRNIREHDSMNMRAREELRRRGVSDEVIGERLMTDLTYGPQAYINSLAARGNRLPSGVSRRDFTDAEVNRYRRRSELTPEERRSRDRVDILSGALQRKDGRSAFSRAEGGPVKSPKKFAKGGSVKSPKKFAKGGSASKRADGCAKKGKTKGKMV